MPVHHVVPRAVPFVLACLLLAACGGSAGGQPPGAAPGHRGPDPAGAPAPDVAPEPDPAAGPHEVSVVLDLGPLPDGSGGAVVTTTWTVDAAGTTRLVVDTPAGVTERHVMTEDEHWYWIVPAARGTLVDAEWIHFDLRAIDEVGGVLPESIVEARGPVPQPGEIVVGDPIAGQRVVEVEVVGDDEVRLGLVGVERPVVHRRRALPAGTAVEIPTGAVDVSDLPDVLRW